MLIIDNSISAEWLLHDSKPEATRHADKILQRLISEQAMVPLLWHFEHANIQAIALRQNRATPVEIEAFRKLIARLVIVSDPRSPEDITDSLVDLAERHRLTAYDAAYLELAEHTGLPLATLDDALRRAATELGIPLA